jgi:hypothetical protein
MLGRSQAHAGKFALQDQATAAASLPFSGGAAPVRRGGQRRIRPPAAAAGRNGRSFIGTLKEEIKHGALW